MKKHLNEQLARMQKLAGIIKENQQTIKEFNFDQFSSGNTSTPKASFEDKWNSIPAANKEILKKSTGKEPIEIMASSKGMNFVITKGLDGKFYRYEYTQAEKPGEPMGPFNNTEEAKKLKENTTYTNEGEGAYEYEKGKEAGEKIEKKKMTKEQLKSKIKEMILAELTEDSTEDQEITDDNADYEPVAEMNGPYNRNQNDTDDMENMNLDDFDYEDENYSDDYIDDYDSIYDQGIDEAKKDKEEEVEDVTIDNTTTEELPDETAEPSSNDIPNIQSHLQSAYAEAKQLGDEKLITQIANTITYFTKAHVLDTAPVNESMFPMLKKILK